MLIQRLINYEIEQDRKKAEENRRMMQQRQQQQQQMQQSKQNNETESAGLLRQLRQQRTNLESEVDNMKTNFVGARVSKFFSRLIPSTMLPSILPFPRFRRGRRFNVNQAR